MAASCPHPSTHDALQVQTAPRGLRFFVVSCASISIYRRLKEDIIDEKMHYRERVAEKIALEIEEEIDGLMVWITKSKVDNMVAHFNQVSGQLADETIEILNKRYQFEGKDKEFLEKIVHSKFREMVMPSIKQLKTLDSEDDILRFEKTLAFLFSGGNAEAAQ